MDKLVFYIAKRTPYKPAPRQAIVNIVQETLKKYPIKFRKHIKKVNVQKIISNGSVVIGCWIEGKKQLKVYDHSQIPVSHYKNTIAHELAHAYFHWALKWHYEEVKEFCKTVRYLAPYDTYMKNHASRWLCRPANLQSVKHEDYDTVTLWANEYHSAIAAEINGGSGAYDGNDYHKCRLTKEQLLKAREAYNTFHGVKSVD